MTDWEKHLMGKFGKETFKHFCDLQVSCFHYMIRKHYEQQANVFTCAECRHQVHPILRSTIATQTEQVTPEINHSVSAVELFPETIPEATPTETTPDTSTLPTDVSSVPTVLQHLNNPVTRPIPVTPIQTYLIQKRLRLSDRRIAKPVRPIKPKRLLRKTDCLQTVTPHTPQPLLNQLLRKLLQEDHTIPINPNPPPETIPFHDIVQIESITGGPPVFVRDAMVTT